MELLAPSAEQNGFEILGPPATLPGTSPPGQEGHRLIEKCFFPCEAVLLLFV
jgi:hypothetical protein